MCGILGIMNLEDRGPIPLDTLVQAGSLLNHRGPDESGVYVDDNVGLYHARLSIIDLSSGTQPIHNEDCTKWIVFNGEIFNYPELKKDLESKGHRFYTNSDTEVLIHLYEEKGTSMLQDLNGQFAFAIWDSADRELFIARDRVGIIPLHYAFTNGRLYFASEIKAIMAASGMPADIDPEALDQIFTFWTTLPDKTAFKGIGQLPPGHYLTVSSGSHRISRYWDYSFDVSDNRSFDTTMDELHALTLDALKIRLRADVPVGSYLSGGFDSSLLTALISKRFDNNLRTFGIGFEDPDFDESDYQRQMVEFLDVDHTRIVVGDSDIGSAFGKVLKHCETPLLRTAPVPLLNLSAAVRDSGYKVVVTGEGADEVFAGYNIFLETKVRAFWARQPGSKLRPLLIGKLYPYIFKDKRLEKMLHSFFGNYLDRLSDPFYSHLIRWNNTSKIKAFFSEETRGALKGYDCVEDLRDRLPEGFGGWESLAKAQYLEMSLFMGNYLLSSQGDRMAMANSVEVRPPYLDHRVVELAGSIPSHWKIRGLKEKFILKKSFEKTIPKRITDRPKQPYRAPIRSSLLNNKNQNLNEYLSQSSLKNTGLFDSKKVAFLEKKMKNAPMVSETDEMAITGILSSQMLKSLFMSSFTGLTVESVEPDLFVDKRSKGRSLNN